MNSFKRNLIIGYSFSLVLLLGSAIASYISISNLVHNNDLVDHTNLVIKKLENTISILKDAETGQRGYLLTNDDQFLQPYNGSLERVYAEIKDLRTLTSDNQLQQLSLIKLTDVVQNRMSILQKLVDQKKNNIGPSSEDMRTGKIYMDQCRQLVNQMEDRENQLLANRTAEAKKFAESTPLFIVIASFLSILITVISFIRLNKDYNRRKQLQDDLIEKDKETTERINIISAIAEKVTAGNYTARVDESYRDKLGNLSISLNKMTSSLEHSFNLLSKKEWLQTGVSELNERLIGEKNIGSLASGIISQLVEYTGSNIAAFYHYDNGLLRFIKGHSFIAPQNKNFIKEGDGIVGQAIVSGKMISVENILQPDITVNYAAGDIKPKQVIALPVLFEGHPKAVIMLASTGNYESRHKEYLNMVSENIGIAINTAETNDRLNDLLQETQAQTEELGAQHSELENINAELEAQSEKLKVSEEELKVQQEELLESNSELEERTRLLEERNQLIAEQNIDIGNKAKQLEISSKYKSEFLANMSHELRTPLNSILLLSRLLSENAQSNLSREQVEFAKVIQGSGQGLLSLIDEILDLSKIESGKMEINYAETAVNTVVNNMESLFRPIANDKKLEFSISVDETVPKKINTDILRLEQILKNLLSNALKFTAAGSVTMNISKDENDFISFSVKDTGIGIADEKQAIVFEAFQQEDGSTRRNFGGTGLGLSISRDLATLLGGSINLRSEQGRGSEFTLSIPAAKPEQSNTGKVIPGFDSTKKSPTNLPVDRTDKGSADFADDRNNIKVYDKIILIIEDDIVFAETLLKFTRDNGYKGILATRGDEGLEFAKKYLPVGILLDIYLPVMDGWEVMKELKAGNKTKHIPIHVMSSIEVKNKSLHAGAADFINKPLEPEAMHDIFKKISQLANNDKAKKVLIIEENEVHAKALAYFLQANGLNAAIGEDVQSLLQQLESGNNDCIILDMGSGGTVSYDALKEIRDGAEHDRLFIIVFTGKAISPADEMNIKKYADSIVIKTAHSYKRLLDEVSLFINQVVGKKIESNRLLFLDVLKDKKILLVDDDVRNIYSLTKAMEQYQMNVISAIDGKDALKQLKENTDVQLVLMDMMMPEMDGYQTTRYIRSLDKYNKLPVIAVTAKAMAGDREKCIEAGASDYITKPVDTDQLISLLRVWLYDKK